MAHPPTAPSANIQDRESRAGQPRSHPLPPEARLGGSFFAHLGDLLPGPCATLHLARQLRNSTCHLFLGCLESAQQGQLRPAAVQVLPGAMNLKIDVTVQVVC